MELDRATQQRAAFVVNGNAWGVWRARIGARMELIRYAPNGRSAVVRDGAGHKAQLPTRWLTALGCEEES